MKKLLTRLVSLARGSIAVAAIFATILAFAAPVSAVPATGVYLYGTFTEGGTLEEIGCFNGSSDSKGTVPIAASNVERTFYYVVYSWNSRYGHPGGNFEQKMSKNGTTSYDYHNAVKVEQVLSSSNDYYYFKIPANVEVVMSYENGFGFNNDNYNGFTSGKDRGVWISSWTDKGPVVTTKDYFINYQQTPGNDKTWTDSSRQAISSNGVFTFTVNLKKGSHFGIKNADNTFYGPAGSNTYVAPGDAPYSTFSLNDKHFIWNGEDGDVEIKVELKDDCSVKSITFPEATVSDDLYVFSTNSGDWNNATGGRALAAGQTIEFSAAKQIYFVFGPKQTFNWNSSTDKAMLYGAQYEREVVDGETRIAHHGNSQVFKIGSGKWNLTVTEFVKGETVTFTVKRLGDADIPADGYVEYVLYDETDNTAFELEWDINAGNYRGKVTDGVQAALGANKKGHLFTVRAKKNGATEFDKFGKPDNNHWYIQSGANSVDLTKDAKSLYLNCDKEHYIKVDVKDGRYTAPSNVAFIEVGNPENAGKVYLVAPFLNDNYESPAWELKPQSDGSYFLGEFAMRNNEHKNDNGNQYYIDIAVYDEFGTRTIKTVKREGFRVPREYTRQPGRKCTATLDKDMTVLTITAVPDETLASVLPYVGIVGKNFRQSVNMKTRHDYTKNGEERMGHTDDGWQEAYVEYGQFGLPLLDANGEAYYNTVWPPRNNILMQSYLGEGIEPLNVSSRDLTMTPDARGIMTGAQWVAALQAENADEYKESYDGLSDTGADKNGFKLDANRKYARYVVKNVWMMGEYKIWTGFAGKLASFGADWNSFRYWGPGGRDDNAADNRRKEMHKTYILYGEQNNFFTEDLGENNNVKDYAREYYRSMEFFIPVNDQETDFEYLGGNDEIRPRFYLTKAVGGAKIDAIATGTVGNQKVGYAPTFENMSGYHVGGYTVTRYAYDANTDVENLLPCDQNRTATKKEAAKVVGATGVNYTDVTAFLDALKEGKTTFTTSGGKTEWIPDGQEKTYAPGRYIFRFEVTYVNDLDANDTKTADVWSPYFEIFEEQGAVHIFHAQLVELPEDHELAKQGYKYVSYTKDRSRFHRVAVKADASDKPTELTRQESDAMIASLREVYLKTGVWTNKNLLLTEEPENFRGDKTDFKFLKKEGEVDAAGEYTNVANLLNADAPKIRNWYAWIDNNKAQIVTPETYQVYFKGKLITVNGNETTETMVEKDNETVYYPQFPLPYIDTPNVTVDVKLTENTDEWPALYTATHEHLNIVEGNVSGENGYEDTNPFQQWREDKVLNRLEVRVPVQLPNISMADGLRDAAYDKLTVKVNDKELGVDKENVAGGRAYIVYDHQSPYDWLTYVNEWKAKDATSWNTTGSAFATTDCAIEGIKEPGIHDKTAVLATFAPSFDTPSLSLEDGTLGFRGEWSGPENGIYTYTGYLTVFNPKSHPFDALVGNNDLVPEENGSYTPQYLCHVESTGDVDGVSNVETVSQVISEAGGKYKLVSAKVRAENLENMSDFMRTLKLSFSRAYYFFSGNKDGVTETTTHRNCGSTLVGLTGEFPFHIGGDIHTAAPSAAPVQNAEGQPNGEAKVNLEPSTTGHSSTLYAGDNAFLFAPMYKTFDFSLLSDIQVGIDGSMDSDVRVVTGKGFIDLLGNEGRIYSTDGRLVYSGASRAEVISGVYVVVLDGKTVKVFVK